MARILLMEDCSVQAMMLADWLEAAGHTASIASNPQEATQQLRGEQQFDLIITDIFGPDESTSDNGLTFILSLRAMDNARLSNMPIISISGASLEHADPAAARRIQGDARHVHLMKPIDFGQLSSTIAQFTS